MADRTEAFIELLEPIRSELARAAILCDIDGTLAPISARPEDAVVPDDARSVLRALAARYALVGCLSGRRATEARRMVGVDELVYVGNHGFESVAPGDEEPRVDPAVSERADAARELVDALGTERFEGAGLRVEDKGAIQSLHWRGAADEEAAQRDAEAIAAAAEERDLEARWGRKVLELRPVAGIDKGSAIERLIDQHGADRALYGGDDVTDLDAFRALRRMRSDGRLTHAACVGVASDEEPSGLREQSDVVVAGTTGFLDLLNSLV